MPSNTNQIPRNDRRTAFFSSDEVAPLTLVLLLDASSSIKPSEKGIKEAASNLVRAMSTRDKTAVVIFNDKIQRSTYFTAFQEPLLDAIRELYPEGWTALCTTNPKKLLFLARI